MNGVNKNREYDYFEEHVSEYARRYWDRHIKGIPSTDLPHPAGAKDTLPKAGTDPERTVRREEPTAGGEGTLITCGGRCDGASGGTVQPDDRDHNEAHGGTGTTQGRDPRTDQEGEASEVSAGVD